LSLNSSRTSPEYYRTPLWRAFDDLHPEELRGCLQSICGELLADHEHAGEFVVIDGRHIAAN
jgi:hypothetical protein